MSDPNFTDVVLLIDASNKGVGTDSDWTDVVLLLDASAAVEEAEPLDPPANLQATAVGTNQINVTWDAVAGADGYEIEIDSGTPIDVGNVLAYEDTGLAPGTTRSYRVRAYAAGSPTEFSEWAGPVEATTESVAAIPRRFVIVADIRLSNEAPELEAPPAAGVTTMFLAMSIENSSDNVRVIPINLGSREFVGSVRVHSTPASGSANGGSWHPSADFYAVGYNASGRLAVYDHDHDGNLSNPVTAGDSGWSGSATGNVNDAQFHPETNHIAAAHSSSIGTRKFTIFSFNKATKATTPAAEPDFSDSVGASAPVFCRWHPSGDFVYVGIGAAGNNVNAITAYSWDGSSLTEIQTFVLGEATTAITGMDISPDGARMLVTQTGHAYLLSIAANGQLSQLSTLAGSNLQRVSFAPNDKHAMLGATGVGNGRVVSWETDTLTVLANYPAGLRNTDSAWPLDGLVAVRTSTDDQPRLRLHEWTGDVEAAHDTLSDGFNSRRVALWVPNE